ncbi:MAG TPA: radical SAM protein [Myxococcota bacterium]|nr:radical SAM protein [Myxococcota bacterium]HOH77052.1 radical SAM protein [Myxococcota bacterium]HPV04599.1 radical SAM protein [Myxococcota bacterium]
MPSRSMLFIVPPMVLEGDFIDYPWAADLGALCSAARVAAAGWRVTVFDALARPTSGWHTEGGLQVAGVPFGRVAVGAVELVDGLSPDIVVVANHPFLWASRVPAAAMIRDVAASFPGVPIVLADCGVGGMMYVERPVDDVFSAFPGISCYLSYSGESHFADPDALLDAVLSGARHIPSPAVSWDAIPPQPAPMWDSIDITSRHAFNVRFFGESGRPNPFAVGAGSLPMLASAGCAHDCVFCTTNPGRDNHGSGAYRTVPLAALADQLYLMKRAYSCRHVLFLDDAANLRGDFADLLKILADLGLDYDFPNGLRADRLDDAAISAMKGRVTTLSVSCETADPAALRDRVCKRLDPADIERVAESAARHGVPLMVHFIIGFPWETLADVRRTLDFARILFETHGAVPAVQFATPIPGARMERQLREAGIPFLAADGESFQHRPGFVPPGMLPGELEDSMLAFNRRIEASRPSKVIINVTYDCINACQFCAVSNRVRRSIPTARIIEMLDEHRSRGIDNVDFDGGEPMLHPGILDVVGHAAAVGYRQINVTSNGRKLADRELASALVKSGVTSILISLHGDTAQVHDAITGKPGSFDETVAGIDNVMRLVGQSGRQIDFGVNVTVCATNMGHMVGLARMMADRGVPKMNFQFLTPFGAASAGLVPDPIQAARQVQAAIDAVADRMKIYVVNSQMCLFEPAYQKYLLNDLQKLGRTMVFVWEEEVNLFRYLAERRVRRAQCASCPHFLVCDGFYEFPESGELAMQDGGRHE